MDSIVNVSLDSAGLVALADLPTISQRTALTGTSWFTDALFLAPGLHRQQDAAAVNNGELPATAAMTSGYVFRIENQAMVFWMQGVGRPGHLVEAWVTPIEKRKDRLRSRLTFPNLLYALGISMTIASIVILGVIRDYWALGVLGTLVLARAVNVLIIRSRAVVGWDGEPEPDTDGDLLVLLSQDRWVRLRGLVDDLKRVTAGQWLRDPTPLESFATNFSTLLVYCAAALVPNASTVGSLFIIILLLASVFLLMICNALTRDLTLFDRRVSVSGAPKAYKRRLDMAKEMIEAHREALVKEGKDPRGWAVQMGLVLPETAKGRAEPSKVVTM